jgi:hypothetical protein
MRVSLKRRDETRNDPAQGAVGRANRRGVVGMPNLGDSLHRVLKLCGAWGGPFLASQPSIRLAMNLVGRSSGRSTIGCRSA